MWICKRFWTMALVLCASLAEPAITMGDGLKPKAINELRVHVLNVGDALCSVVECPGSYTEAMVFDCGKYGNNNVMDDKQIQTYLATVLGGKTVRVVLSHPDNDHVNRITNIPPKQVKVAYLGSDYNLYTGQSLQNWLNNLDNDKKLRYGFRPGDSGAPKDLACGEATTEVLTVNAGLWLGEPQQKRNADSLVAAVSYGKFTAVFPGDADSQTLASILFNKKGGPIRASLLVAPHHGSTKSGENGFLWDLAFTPQAVIYSAGNTSNPRCMDIKWTQGGQVDVTKSTFLAYKTAAPADQKHMARCATGEAFPKDWVQFTGRGQTVCYLSQRDSRHDRRPGWDGHGRLSRQRWQNENLLTTWSSEPVAQGPARRAESAQPGVSTPGPGLDRYLPPSFPAAQAPWSKRRKPVPLPSPGRRHPTVSRLYPRPSAYSASWAAPPDWT